MAGFAEEPNVTVAANAPLAEPMIASAKTNGLNAYVNGIGATKRIVLFDTLIKNHTTDELVAVLAHEIGHFKLRHITQHIAGAMLARSSGGRIVFISSISSFAPPIGDSPALARPPWASAMACTIARPSPAPPETRSRLGSVRWKRSNTRSR